MKRVVKKIFAGINGRFDEKTGKYKFEVNLDGNSEDDVIQFVEPYFQQSTIDDNTYWFGYSFNDGQPNPRRDEFIEFIKTVQPEKLNDPEDEWSGYSFSSDHITEPELRSMIIRSLDRIKLNNYSVDTIVYPESKSGNLVKMIVRCISDYIHSARRVCSEEFKKADPSEIEFDFDKFYRDMDGMIDVPEYVDDDYIRKMLNKARNSDSFSLRRLIKPAVLRNYVSNFYSIDKNVSTISSAEVILLVDDFGTTGTTIRELIRNIRSVNQECEIYIFTLMGNKRSK